MQEDPYWNIRNMVFGSNPREMNNRPVPNTLAIMQSGNLYAYALNNPIRYTDPSGLMVMNVVRAVIRQATSSPGGAGGAAGAAVEAARTTSAPTQSVTTTQPVVARPASVATQAAMTLAMNNIPRIISRAEWGPLPATLRVNDNRITEIVIHHTAGGINQRVQDIDRWHREGRGWDGGIGYHFLIRYNGTIYEGRPLQMRGAHAGDRNYRSIGIAVIGNFYPSGTPTQAQRDSLFWLIDHVRTEIPTIERITPHHNQCPGPWFNRFF